MRVFLSQSTSYVGLMCTLAPVHASEKLLPCTDLQLVAPSIGHMGIRTSNLRLSALPSSWTSFRFLLGAFLPQGCLRSS